VLFREEGEGMIYTLKLSSKRVGAIVGALSLLAAPKNRGMAISTIREIEAQTNAQYEKRKNPQAAEKKRF
jgi:hypothetical protein